MHEHHITILGATGNAGAYLLRISLAEPITTPFGRLYNGHPLALEAGQYLYAGSARGQRGSSALPCRLLRHASRTRLQPPQRIYAALAAALTAADFTGVHPLRSAKTLHWHIDYLLELPKVEIVAVSVLRHVAVQEAALARWLASMPRVSTPIPGFGASDDPGASHLLQAPTEDAWWEELRSQLQAWFTDAVRGTASAS